LLVLPLAVLHDQRGGRVEGVNRQVRFTTALAGIATQPVEPVLSLAGAAEHLVTEIQDIRLVTGLSAGPSMGGP